MPAPAIRKIKKLLVANRGEIALRILRAADELKISTVAVYTFEDRYSLHRYKADEAYLIGDEKEALKPYLDINEIVGLAKKKNVDAIHPGYGFLSENVELVRACERAGIIFVGPREEAMLRLGDKVNAKEVALKCAVPLIQDSGGPIATLAEAQVCAKKIGFPMIIKAAAGGGGRGMRVVRSAADLDRVFDEAGREALRAFGDGRVFLEKFIENPKHLEVQILGDNYGNLVHLFERDCSVQRRFQKVIEVAPSTGLKRGTREKLYDYALRIGREVNYNNAGTVEFLLDPEENIYFIEVNPRIQVEHTVTEEITGIDLVRTQLLVAQGYPLDDPGIYLKNQRDIQCHGFAIQCRVTTEDPEADFKPDYGKLIAYRSPGGFGIRLDGGNVYPGAAVSPFFDSMLVKVTASGRTLKGALQRLSRALREFRIRGVKTNVPFLHNVINHPVFQEGKATVKFLELYPEVLKITKGRDRATRVLNYLAEVTVNGNPDVKGKIEKGKRFYTARVPEYDRYAAFPEGTKDRLTKLGADKFCQWLRKSKEIQYTDTTFRDAHQSLLATRVRTYDLARVAESFAKRHPQVFSMEVWGGATFDVALRFLHECPWERLKVLRSSIPNILLQMLLRGDNAVGYTAYPDNLVQKFIVKSWETGIDIFRIFDSMNWLEAMKLSIRTVRNETGGIAEGCICYTGDFLDPKRQKFSLQYYLDLARRIEDEGAHILGLKDMAGLLKPYAAEILVAKLREKVSIPVHLHTHDSSSLQSATYLKAVEAGVDVIDVALGTMSGLTSQPNFEAVVSMLKGHPREQAFDVPGLLEFSNYWEAVRTFYYPFESEMKAGSAEVFFHEIPGGQYSNLRPQARSLGLEEKFEQIKKNYELVNRMMGDVVKVTPSSKVVGDVALYMTASDLTEEDVLSGRSDISFPASLVGYFRGDIGQPHGGFPKRFQEVVLKGEKPFTNRPNEHLKPCDFESELTAFKKRFGDHRTELDLLSYLMYPKVFEEYHEHDEKFGRVTTIPSVPFFFGLENGQETLVEIEEGKMLIIEMVYVGKASEDGKRSVTFKLNGETRTVEVVDQSTLVVKAQHRKAQTGNEIGSPLRGKVSKILVKQGATVVKDAPLFVIEAMKMETTVGSPLAGTVKKLHLPEGTMVFPEDLIVELG